MYRIGKEEIDAAARVIASKQLFRVGGELRECANFEKEWAEKIGTKNALLISGGGTAALTSAIAALGIGPGDEVLIPAYTWISTASAVLTCGAIPVICEIDDTVTIDPEDIKRKITPNTKAVIPVHMGGHPCEMDTICKIAKEHKIAIIEDACQDDGGMYKGKRVGTWGDIGCFSFNYYKIISSGEGGCIITDNDDLFQKICCYCDCGSFFWSDIEFKFPIFVAQQFRANEIQGAIMREQLKKMDDIIADLKSIRKTIIKELNNDLNFIPSKDEENDTGINVICSFEDEKTGRAFCEEVNKTGLIYANMGIDHGKHIFTNWTPLQTKTAGHIPAMNAFNFPQNKNLRADYRAEICPKTLEYLSKYVFMGIDPDMTEEHLDKLIKSLKNIAKNF